ncbi:hypothetical protein [Subtercola sp. YIM 133946]|uniref:hypothetical protein n=1 Tax=Subtercola sp. YIM 133946 TaxID=3118909 RepID=UPI002F94DB5A
MTMPTQDRRITVTIKIEGEEELIAAMTRATQAVRSLVYELRAAHINEDDLPTAVRGVLQLVNAPDLDEAEIARIVSAQNDSALRSAG